MVALGEDSFLCGAARLDVQAQRTIPADGCVFRIKTLPVLKIGDNFWQ